MKFAYSLTGHFPTIIIIAFSLMACKIKRLLRWPNGKMEMKNCLTILAFVDIYMRGTFSAAIIIVFKRTFILKVKSSAKAWREMKLRLFVNFCMLPFIRNWIIIIYSITHSFHRTTLYSDQMNSLLTLRHWIELCPMILPILHSWHTIMRDL